jgi:hypothetical protein
MAKHYLIRFNKTRGLPGRGTENHVWRVFEEGKEYLFKHVRINVPCWDERTEMDWNIACDGFLKINRKTSTATINHRQSSVPRIGPPPEAP